MFRMPWNDASTPNLMLEVTNTCNIRCPACFSPHGGRPKSLEEIAADLDDGSRLRKLHTVTLSGGEPTLHPQLVKIVEMVRQRGLLCFLLTNGVSLDRERLGELALAGLDSVLFHVDVGQTRPDLPKPPTFADVQRRLRELTRMAVALNVDVSYSVTLYRDRPQQLEEMVDFFMSMPDATFLFVARAKDPLTSHHVAIDDPSDSSSIVSTRGIEQVQRLFRETYGIEPYAYIPAVNAQGREVRPPIWISYFLPVSYRGGRLRRILPVQTTDLDRSVMYLPRLYRGHFIHKTNQKPLLTAARLLLNSISSRRVGSLASFLVDTWRSGADLRHKMVVYDDGTFLDDAGERVVCEYCPTAIVRKGRLVKCCDSINDDLERQASEPKQEGIRA